MTDLSPDQEAMEIEEDDGEYRDDLQEPPSLNFTNVASVLRRKGYVGAISDEAMGPHIHLITVLGIVVIIAVVVVAMGLV